jgi:glycosyltransferase involved in cell wall biosynthesis
LIIHTEPNVWSGYRRMTAWANALTYRRNAAVIAVSDAVAASIRPPLPGWPMPPVDVVVHGIDQSEVQRGPAEREEGRRRLGYGGDELVVGVVASLTPKKDHRTLLSAFALVAAELPGARLVVVGGGRLDQDLRRFANEVGISGVVQFMGARTDVLQLLPGLDAIALSSHHEGLPIALVEALATGIPCVATAVGGVPEVVEHGQQGFLVEPGDVRGLAQSLLKLLSDDDLRREMATAAAQRGSELDLPSAIERTQSIYERVLAGR